MKSSLWWRHIVPQLNTCCILSLMTFDESKCAEYLNFLWIYSQTHYSDVRWFTSKWTLGHRRKKRGGGVYTPRLPFHFIIQYFYTNPDRKRTLLRHNFLRTFLVKWTGWRIFVTVLYMDCMYRRILLKFFKQAVNFVIF